MSFDLSELLHNRLGGTLNSFLSANGETAENSGKAVSLTLPAVVAGLVKYVSGSGDNSRALHEILSGSNGAALDNALSNATDSTGISGLIESGKQLLPELTGGRAEAVSDQISWESGISKAASGSLLALALPLVLSVLRGKVQGENLSASQTASLLGQQQDWLSGALGSNMLTALGISSLGSLFGGLTGLGAGAAAAAGATIGKGTAAATGAGAAAAAAGSEAVKKGGIGKWILLALALIAALFAFKSCKQSDTGTPAPAGIAASGASAVSDSTAASDVQAAPADIPASPASAAAASGSNDAAASAVLADMAATASAASAAPAAPAADAAAVTYENGVAKFYFATGKSNVADGAQTVVGDVITAGKEGKKLVISGFTDSTGNAKANEALSKRRAEAVRKFFESQGVDAKNIELRKPKSSVGAQGNDAEGRRVEVTVEG